MDREKIHKLLDLILEIQERGEGRNGYPYVNIEFSNYGSRIFLTARETDKQLDDAIILVGVLLEMAVDKTEDE